MSSQSHLAPFFYQYGVGLIVVLLGIYAGWRAGIWRRGQRRWLALMIVGWVFFMLLQGGLQVYAGRAAGTDVDNAARGQLEGAPSRAGASP